MKMNSFNIVLIGDAGVGKSSLLKRLNGGDFNMKYVPTFDAEVTPLHFSTNKGGITLNMWDVSGQQKFVEIPDCKADAYIVMFDVTSKTSYGNIKFWINSIHEETRKPITICGNKVDIADRKVKVKKTPYTDLSVKSMYNVEKVILGLIRTLLEDETVEIVLE